MISYDSDGDTGHKIYSKYDNISAERYRDYSTHLSTQTILRV